MSELPPQPVRLHLYAGPAVAVPTPQALVDALREVTIENGSGETQSGFELVFEVPKGSPLTTLFLLTGGVSVPLFRIVLAVTVGGSTEVVADGVMTEHEFKTDGPASTLHIKGKDLTAVMDIFELDGIPYPAMPSGVRALSVLAKYAALGVTPLVIPALVEPPPLPIDKIPRHQGSDYAYLKKLAHDVGYVFYIDPGPLPGMSKAYWGPEVRVGIPQRALDGGLDSPHDNVTGLSFTLNKETKSVPVATAHDVWSKAPIPVPVPATNPLRPLLGVVPPLPPKLTNLPSLSKLSVPAAIMKAIAFAGQHDDTVTGTGQLEVSRYGRVLRSRALVGVRGAGEAFNGLYYVNRVTHKIARGSYTQSFTLARNALLSTVPEVPV